jgi:thioredoxin reductase
MPLEISTGEGKPGIRFEFPPKPNTLSDDNEIWVKPDFVLVACGREPNNGLLAGLPDGADTPGLYIAGDVRGGKRQISIAVGNAIERAMDIETGFRKARKCEQP